MDFHARLLQQLPETQVRGWKEPLPFYMAQPGYYRPGQEEQCLRDMEYLQQLYPDEIKKVRRRIAEILDLTDYEGSMIYDEYPDRGQCTASGGKNSQDAEERRKRGKYAHRSDGSGASAG